ncbi:uncharacterized protein LOC109823583 [Asparagus officinalis]|uniref:uncharacterized protein LOC109823583 n=1 Tax=Asparagus officinalis TaxID=4686 RepID=UPI00098E0F05|nr:uncharacterized protein LOC109823583 [Asparagus officinalis]
MKRMKRKRIEDTADIPSYMSNHSIFSYYENKRAETDCQSVDNDCGHRGDEAAKRNEDYEWLLLGLNDGDDSLEKVLHNLDNIQSKVLSLKTKLSKVMSKNSREIYPRARSLSCSPVNNGDTMPQNNISEFLLTSKDCRKSLASVKANGSKMTVMKTICSLNQLKQRYLQKEKTSGRDGNSVMYELAERALHESMK